LTGPPTLSTRQCIMTDKTERVKMTYIRTPEGAFVCPDCGITKTRQNTMFYHMKKHAGDTPHVCREPGCGKAFIQKSGLQQHTMQTHPVEGAAPLWSCPAEGCTHQCRVKVNLIIHVGRKHGEGWIPSLDTTSCCVGCNKLFASPTAYYYHATSCFKAPAAFEELLHPL